MRKPPPAHELVRQKWGNQIQALRKRRGLSQHGLATLLATSQSVVSDVESGRYRAMTPELILRICVALDCEPDDICAWPFAITTIAAHNAAGETAA